MSTAEQIADLQSGRLDVGFTRLPLPPSLRHFAMRPVLSGHLALVRAGMGLAIIPESSWSRRFGGVRIQVIPERDRSPKASPRLKWLLAQPDGVASATPATVLAMLQWKLPALPAWRFESKKARRKRRALVIKNA